MSPSLKISRSRAVAIAQRALWRLQASATATRATEIYRARGVRAAGLRLRVAAGARLALGLDPQGITVSARPGLILSTRLATDVHLRSLRYHFADARVTVDARGGRTPLRGWSEALSSDGLEARISERVAPLLPEAMRTPGYAPATDPALLENLEALVGGIGDAMTRTHSSGRLRGLGSDVAADLHLYLHAVAPEALHVDLPSLGLEAFSPLGTSLFLSVQTDGPLSHPQVRSCKLSSAPPGVVLRTPTEGSERPRVALDLRRAVLLPGGRMDFGYELSLDDVVALPTATRRLLGLDRVDFRLAGQPAQLDALRGALDALLEQALPERLRAFSRRMAPWMPTIDWEAFFALEAQDVTPPSAASDPARRER